MPHCCLRSEGFFSLPRGGASALSLSPGVLERSNELIVLGSLTAVPRNSGSRGDLEMARATPLTPLPALRQASLLLQQRENNSWFKCQACSVARGETG